MMNILSRYFEDIQNLRVKAGLVRVSIKELKRALIRRLTVSAAISVAILLALYYTEMFSPTYVAITSCLAILIPLSYPYMKYWHFVRSRRRTLEEEFDYFIISEAIAYTYSTELVSDMCDLAGWGSVFKELSREGMRLSLFRKFLTTFETVSIYIRYSISEHVARLLSDYMLSLARGVIGPWLSSTSNELLHKLRSKTKALVQLRTTMVLVVGVVVGYLPSLIISMSIITGSMDLTLMIIIIPVMIFSLLVLPRPTLHLRAVSESARRGLPIALLIYVVTYITLLYALSSLSLTICRYVLLSLSVLLIANGILNTLNLINVVVEVSELPRLILTYAETPYLLINPLQGLKEVLRMSRSRNLRLLSNNISLNRLGEGISAFKSWLGRYVYYVVVKSISNGSLGKEQLLNLRMLTIEMVEDLKHYVVSLLPLIAMSFIMPWLLMSMSMLAGVNVVNYLIPIYILVATYALYVDYVVLDAAGNTLITGASLLILTLWV